MRFVAILLALSLATACGSSRQTRTAGLIAGGALVAGGVGMFVAMDPGDDDHTLTEGGTAACVVGGCVLAGTAIVAGLAVAALSVILTPDDEKPDAQPTVAVADPTDAGVAAPAPVIKVDLLPVGPLPDQDAEVSTVQLARQARSAAARGDCSVAIVMRDEIQSRDPSYATALTSNATLGDCH